jgi:hypothetical protein
MYSAPSPESIRGRIDVVKALHVDFSLLLSMRVSPSVRNVRTHLRNDSLEEMHGVGQGVQDGVVVGCVEVRVSEGVAWRARMACKGQSTALYTAESAVTLLPYCG